MNQNRALDSNKSSDFYCEFVLNHKIKVNTVYEDEHILAYHHTKANWPIHIVVLPKTHVSSLLTCEPALLLKLLDVIKKLAADLTQQYGACRILTNLGNYQDSKHLHFHLYLDEI